jgi:hypothetical protein
VRRETGKEERVQVPYDEGVAIRIGPEPCAAAREGKGAAKREACLRPRGVPMRQAEPSMRRKASGAVSHILS